MIDHDLIAAAKRLYKRLQAVPYAYLDEFASECWREFTDDYPALAALAAEPKKNRGIGSGPDMQARRCWRQSDKSRQYRKPTSALSLADPEFHRTEDEPDDDLYRDIEIDDAIDDDDAEWLDDGDGAFDDVSGFHLVSENEHRSEQTSRRLLEVCVRCGWPIPLEWRPVCEFPESPMFWFQYFEACHCNGCLGGVKRKPGQQPRYCSDDCKRDANNARRRAGRRRAVVQPPRHMPVRKCAHCLSVRYAECGSTCRIKCDCEQNHTCVWCRK